MHAPVLSSWYLWAVALLWSGALSASAVDLTLDGANEGRTYDGHGAVSAGASSRLLIDYPEPQRSQILDYLFTPGYGAALQHLKVEIGGAVNSTDGTEPTHMRSATDQNYQRGYEWWLMKEARARNPGIILDCLAWGAPGWIGNGNYWSQDMADYIANFLNGALRQHQLDIAYTGVRNEVRNHVGWIKTLRNTLDARGLSQVRIVAGDEWGGSWHIVDDMVADPVLSNAVHAVGAHYASHQGHDSPANAKTLTQPLWGTEEGIGGASWNKALSLARLYNRNYIVGKMTKNEIWSPISSYYDILAAAGSGLMKANQPWSGHYEVSPAIWATAHTTQFAHPGWTYLEGGASALLPDGGSLVTLKSTNGVDYCVVVETSDATVAQTLNLHVTNGLSAAALRVWKTSPSVPFAPVGTIVPVNGGFTYTVDPGCIYSMSTVGGQGRGAAVAPAEAPFPLPYVDDFESYAAEATPRYFSDQAGTFEVAVRADGQGRCLRQVLPQPGIRWAAEWFPYTLAGDPNWQDYEINADVMIETNGFVFLLGRIVDVPGFSDPVPRGYRLAVNNSPGRWEIRDEDNVLASGSVPFAADVWHRLRLTFSGSRITAYVDGVQVGEADDERYPSGMAAVGCGWHHARFDNLSLFPRHAGPGNLAASATASASSVWQNDPAYNAAKVHDRDASTRWNAAWPVQAEEWVELAFPAPVTFNRTTLTQFGDRVNGFRIQHWNGAGWTDDVVGGTLGSARSDTFPAATSSRVRLLIEEMTSTPSIYEFAIYDGLTNGMPVMVSEWMVDNRHSEPDPADGHYESWFELHNLTPHALDLGGYYLTGSLGDRYRFAVPPGTTISPGGFLLAWADNEPEQTQPGSDLHVNFELTGGGIIGVFAPDGSQVDVVEVRDPPADRSLGSVPDGSLRIVSTPIPTPRTSNNRVYARSITEGEVPGTYDVSFTGIPDRRHQVQTSSDLMRPTWSDVDEVDAHPDGQFDYADTATDGVGRRYYRSTVP